MVRSSEVLGGHHTAVLMHLRALDKYTDHDTQVNLRRSLLSLFDFKDPLYRATADTLAMHNVMLAILDPQNKDLYMNDARKWVSFIVPDDYVENVTKGVKRAYLETRVRKELSSP